MLYICINMHSKLKSLLGVTDYIEVLSKIFAFNVFCTEYKPVSHIAALLSLLSPLSPLSPCPCLVLFLCVFFYLFAGFCLFPLRLVKMPVILNVVVVCVDAALVVVIVVVILLLLLLLLFFLLLIHKPFDVAQRELLHMHFAFIVWQ